MVPFSVTMNDPLTLTSRARHYSTLNISETLQDRDIVTVEYYHELINWNDLE